MKKKIMFLLAGLFLCLMLLPLRAQAATQITEVYMTIDYPVIGAAPDMSPTIKVDPKFRLGKGDMNQMVAAKPFLIVWKEYDRETGNRTTNPTIFRENCYYTVEVYASAPSGYKFSGSYDNNTYVNGYALDYYLSSSYTTGDSNDYPNCLLIDYNFGNLYKTSTKFEGTSDNTAKLKIMSSITVPVSSKWGSESCLTNFKDIEGECEEYIVQYSAVPSDKKQLSVSVNDHKSLTIKSIGTSLDNAYVTVTANVYRTSEGFFQPIGCYSKKLKITKTYATAAPYLAKCSVSYANKAFAVTLTNASTHRIYVKSGTFKVTNTKASSRYLKVKNSKNVTIKPGATKTINYKIVSGTYNKTYKKYYRLDTKWKWHEKDRSIRLMLNASKVQYLKDGSWKTLYKK